MVSTKTGFGSDMVSFFKNRIGSDIKSPLSDHLCRLTQCEGETPDPDKHNTT